MKQLLLGILFILLVTINSTAQELVILGDSIKNFKIGVPVGWRYLFPIEKVDFAAYSQKENDSDLTIENFNINLLHWNEKDLNRSFDIFIKEIGDAEEFKILDQGEKVINNRNFKYLIESHKNSINKADMINYVFFTNNDGEILVLTMVSSNLAFEKYRILFDRIARSLKTYESKEKLKISWPENEKWRIISNIEDTFMILIILLLYTPYFLVPLMMTLIFKRLKLYKIAWTYVLTGLLIFSYPVGFVCVADIINPPLNPPPPGPRCGFPPVVFFIMSWIIFLPVSLLLQFVFNKRYLTRKELA